MYRFLEDLKKYLEECFKNDADLTSAKKPYVYNGYQIQHEPSSKKPEIQIQPLDNAENSNYTTFCGRNADYVPTQITVYTGQLKIGGVDYSAQDASVILAEKVDDYVYDYIYSCQNKNIYEGSKTTSSPALPMNETGSIYFTSVRFSFTIAHPYVVG